MFYVVAALVALILAVYVAVFAFSHKPRPVHKHEQFFETTVADGSVSSKQPLVALERQLHKADEDDDVFISVVVPCYNETKRLGVMLEDAVPVLDALKQPYEVIIVDDGSRDKTPEFALEWAAQHMKPGTLRVTRLAKNRGKGGAVAHGMRFSRGKYVLFADADGASDFKDMPRLLEAVKVNDGVAIGSRAHMVGTDAVVKRSFIRNFLMRGLHLLVWTFGVRTIRDTQCGFKLFSRRATNSIFPYMHTEGWIFDVEVLMLAQRKGLAIAEIPISWHEVEGSKIDLAADSIKMAIDLVVTRVAYIIGVYGDREVNFKVEE